MASDHSRASAAGDEAAGATSAHPLAAPRRLHPASVLFQTLRYARQYLIPFVLVVFFARGERWQYWLGAIFVIVMTVEVFRYFTLRYWFTRDDLVVRQGLVFRSERHVRLSRIQNIDLVQNPLHRLFNVAEVRVETASGAEPEATLRVLSLDAVEQMRARVFAERGEAPTVTDEAGGHAGAEAVATPAGSAATTAAAPREVLRIAYRELALLGLLSGRGMVLVGVALGVLYEYGLLERLDPEGLYERYLAALDFVMATLIGLAVIVLGLIVLRLLSAVWAMLRFGGYRLQRVGDDLRLQCGVFVRNSATVPRHRVQKVSVHRSLLQRRFGRASIRIETAGGGGGQQQQDDGRTISRRWFVPIVRNTEVPRLVGELWPNLPMNEREIDWRPLAPGARTRMVRRALLVGLVLTSVAAVLFRPWGALAGAVILPLATWHALRAAKVLGCARVGDALLFRSGVFTRKVSATFVSKVQVVSVTMTPFDRRWDMATLQVDTAAVGPADHPFEIPFLREADARAQQAELLNAAHRSDFLL